MQSHRNTCLVVFMSAILASAVGVGQAKAQLSGCPPSSGKPDGILVIASLSNLAAQVGPRTARAIQAAVEWDYRIAETELSASAEVLYCDARPAQGVEGFNATVTDLMNDRNVVLEIGARKVGGDIAVAYIAIPVRHYEYFLRSEGTLTGYHEAVYEEASIRHDVADLFTGNPELRLFATLALAVRFEEIARVNGDAAIRKRSHSYYCAAVGTLEPTRPGPDFLGLTANDWDELGTFAKAGAVRMMAAADNPAVARAREAVTAVRPNSAAEVTACASTIQG